MDDIDSSNAEHSMNNVPDEASKNNMESSEEENYASQNKMHIEESDPQTEPKNQYDSKKIYENPNKTTDDDKNGETEESPSKYEMPDCSLGEVSLSFGATDSEEERRRIFSQSDSNVDIRNRILGRAFVLCFCDNVN